MIRGILVALALWASLGSAEAQNVQCRTVPPGTSTSNCASEATVAQSRGTVPSGAFSTLPVCSSTTEGQTADVTDSTTDAFGAVITGGGSFHVLAYCNGTNWTVAGGGTSPSGGTVTEQKNTSGAGLSTSGNCDNTTTNAASPCKYAFALNNQTLQANPAGYASVISTTAVMEGAGSACKLTPTFSGRVWVQFTGIESNNTVLQRVGIQAAFGTGTAPVQGATGSGTVVDVAKQITSATANAENEFVSGGIVTGLTPGTAYWFDLQTLVTSNTGTLSSMSCSLMEF